VEAKWFLSMMPTFAAEGMLQEWMTRSVGGFTVTNYLFID
jgi:hypothetical protein